MTITGLHLLQTYKCNLECDHCFVHSCPEAKGIMKISDMRQILKDAKRVGNIKWIYFEGGEPFLYYQTMLWGLRAAKKHGFKLGINTNAYWAVSIEDAHRHNDLSLLEHFKTTTVMLGVIDIAKSRIETVEEITDRLQAALEHIDADRLIAAPDCGLGFLNRELAIAKLANMVTAAMGVSDKNS